MRGDAGATWGTIKVIEGIEDLKKYKDAFARENKQ